MITQKDIDDLTAREPKLDDIGSRYDHIRDLTDCIEECIDRLVTRPNRTTLETKKLIEFCVAKNVLQTVLDTYTGFNDPLTSYKLMKQVDSIGAIKPTETTKDASDGTDSVSGTN